ncbi:TetR/AcrR family transcriptional regulator [Microbacterium testaceum]|nr:TetR/AcrR family transcriptional regulator [Microbacterium testaceum]
MGRPRRYDEDQLLDAAQELFWSRGYDRTSMEDVAAASGVGTSSLYAAYASKLGLFLCVFRRYCEGRVSFVAEATAEPSADLAVAAAQFLERVVDECGSSTDRRGCLLLNTIVELGDRFPEVLEISTATTERMEAVLAEKFLRTAAEQDVVLDAADARAHADRTVLASQGLIQLSRLRVPRERLTALAAYSARASVWESA